MQSDAGVEPLLQHIYAAHDIWIWIYYINLERIYKKMLTNSDIKTQIVLGNP